MRLKMVKSYTKTKCQKCQNAKFDTLTTGVKKSVKSVKNILLTLRCRVSKNRCQKQYIYILFLTSPDFDSPTLMKF